jgi:N-acetylmuramoyl-L-alanine amidase
MQLQKRQSIPAKTGETVKYVVDLVPVKVQAVTAAPSPKIAVKTGSTDHSVQAKANAVTTQPVTSVAKGDDTKPDIPALIKTVRMAQQLAATPKQALTKPVVDEPLTPNELKLGQSNVQPFKGTRDLVVAIDAGHGGKDVGATSASGQLEKDLTLAMAKQLKTYIDAQPGMRAVLTRDEDYFITLSKRPQLARAMGADVFISLHADTYSDSRVQGASFYVLSQRGATSQLAKFVAAHSNSADIQNGLEPWNEKRVNDIGRVALDTVVDDSYTLADMMHQSLKQSGIRLQHSKVQAANFAVLKNIDMPSVLIEMGFISNPQQDKMLQDVAYQKRLAAAITTGLFKFVQVQPEPGVVYAKLKVTKGDNLASIAQRHGTSVDYLARANGIHRNSPLKTGQLLKVPVNMSQRMTAMRSDGRG